jgi:hypothetical protein
VTVERRYTLEEIKVAFTKVFLHAGELWFPYPHENEEIGFESIESTWQEFNEALEEKS